MCHGNQEPLLELANWFTYLAQVSTCGSTYILIVSYLTFLIASHHFNLWFHISSFYSPFNLLSFLFQYINLFIDFSRFGKIILSNIIQSSNSGSISQVTGRTSLLRMHAMRQVFTDIHFIYCLQYNFY